MSSSPSGIAEDINIGSPESKSCIAFGGIAAFDGCIVYSTAFIGNHSGCLLPFFGIERSCNADRLWENGNLFLAAGYPVQTLVPPVISRYSQAVYGGSIEHHL